MKKLYVSALAYMIAGLASGLFFREYTVIANPSGDTSMIGLLHTHLLTLGMMFFLLVMVLEKSFQLSKTKWFNLFFWHYNGGLVLTMLMMLVIGLRQASGLGDSSMLDGIAGLGHIIITVGLGFFFASIYGRMRS